MKTKTIYLDEQKQFRFDLVLDNYTKQKITNTVYNVLTRCPYDDLRSCYKSWSYNKEYEYNKCLQKALKLNAGTWGIISYNSNIFSFGYQFMYNEKRYIALITRDYDYLVEID